MFSKYFRLCEQNILLETARELPHVEKWELFSVLPCSADIIIRCTESNEIMAPEGELLGRDADCTVYKFGDEILRFVDMAGKTAVLSRYRTDGKAENSVTVLSDSWDVAMDFRYMWSTVALPQLLLKKRTLLLHSAYIAMNGEGILFSAASGTGKSTQAALWEEFCGAETVNGDKSAVTADKTQITVHGLPIAGTSGICKNRSMPLKAIVFLKQAPENSVRRLGGAEAISAVFNNTHLNITAPEDRTAALSVAMDICESVPVFELSCTPDRRAVTALKNALDI